MITALFFDLFNLKEKPLPVTPSVSEESKEETCYGISKSEFDELNEIVDEEIKKEEQGSAQESETTRESEENSDVPAEALNEDDDSDEDDSFDEFQDILNKRAEGKNDEVE